MNKLEKYGVNIPEILLPKNVDLSSWSVIACDQFTQDEDYWNKAASIAQGKPSTLNLIFPEVFLGKGDDNIRINKIQTTMNEYLSSGVFAPAQKECMCIERKTSYGRTRKGLVVCVDLDSYEWKPGSKALIRATEATVPERIPPRMKIRNGASLELPHIMLLANDPDDILVGGALKLAKKNPPAYEGNLMQNSGSITGWALSESEAELHLEKALEQLKAAGTDSNGDTFLFAVGDGNHSLATAKAVWEENKSRLPSDSPVRYALVEIVNIYDEGLTFEPIHRVLFDFNGEEVLEQIQKNLGGVILDCENDESLQKAVSNKEEKGAVFGFIYIKNGATCRKILKTQIRELAIAALQPVLDDIMEENNAKKTQIDYIHGGDEVIELGKTIGNTGILLPPISKESFFATINGRGPLPRKSFSMGEASEKRFYVESRRLF